MEADAGSAGHGKRTYRPMGCWYLPVAGVWSSVNRDMLAVTCVGW